eukprot:2588502-Pyramimonas_sp.AAC.1
MAAAEHVFVRAGRVRISIPPAPPPPAWRAPPPRAAAGARWCAPRAPLSWSRAPPPLAQPAAPPPPPPR